MGFNNHGSADAVARLKRPHETIVGVNIGKTKVVPEHEAIADYVASAKRIGPHADYVVVNVSSPNTPGLRNLQATEKLRPLLEAVREDDHVDGSSGLAPTLGGFRGNSHGDMNVNSGFGSCC